LVFGLWSLFLGFLGFWYSVFGGCRLVTYTDQTQGQRPKT